MEEPGGVARRGGGGGGGGPEEWILCWDFATIANPRQVCSWLTAFILTGDNATELCSDHLVFFIFVFVLQDFFLATVKITKLGNRAKHYEPRAQGGFQPNTTHCAPLYKQLLCISMPTQDFSCESVSGFPVSLFLFLFFLFFFLPQKYHGQSVSGWVS